VLHWDSLSLSCVHMLSIVDWMECKGLLVLRFLLRLRRRPVLPPIIASWSKESGGGSGEFIVDDDALETEFVAMINFYFYFVVSVFVAASLSGRDDPMFLQYVRKSEKS